MNAPPHEVNIILLERADRGGGRLHSSLKDAEQSPYEPRKTIQRKQNILKIKEKGNPQQYSPKQTQPTVKKKKEEQVSFCLRRKLVKRSETNEEEEECNTISSDRKNFELPEPYQAVAGPTETTELKKQTRRNHLSSFSLGERTKSADWSIGQERARTTDGSIGEGRSPFQRRNAPGRTVSEPIKVERKQKEINVTISPRRSSPRKIQDCANLEYSTGLEGIELLRHNSHIRLECGSDSKSIWVDQQGFPYSPTPNTAVTRDMRWQKTKRSKRHKGCSDGSAVSALKPEEFCQISQFTSLVASSSDLAAVSRKEALDADSEVRRKCYTWYARLGQPNREQMKRLIARMSSSCGIKTSDIDKLAWINNGDRISVSAMNQSLVETSPRERQEMEVDSCTTEIENSSSNVLTRRAPSRTKSRRRVPARSLSEGLQIISKKAKEQQAGESSYESASTFKRNTPTRAVSDSLYHDGEARERKYAKKKIERDVLEGLSLQKMLHELKSANISPRRCRSHSQADPASSEKVLPGPSHSPFVLEKSKQEVLAKRKKKHSGAQSAEVIPLKSRQQTRSSTNPGTMQPSQKQFEITVLDTRPVQTISTTMAPVGQATSGVSRKENKLAGLDLDGYIAGDRTSIRCTQLVVGKNGKSLDPIVASFMGLDHADKVRFDPQGKEARRPEFVQALSFFSAKRTTPYCRTIVS